MKKFLKICIAICVVAAGVGVATPSGATSTPSYVERALTMALPSTVLGAIDKIVIQLGPDSEITVEGTDAVNEGSFGLPLRVQQDGHDALVTEWSNRFMAQQSVASRTLTLNFPDSRCVVVGGKLRGICLGQTVLRLPKKVLLDLTVSGWTRARFRNVRARTLVLTAPRYGFLRMNGTLANIQILGGGPEFDGVVSGVLAADPNNANAGDFTAQLTEFRTLLLARIQGRVQIASETLAKDAYLRVDDQVITQFPYDRP